jgi:hypothetical protein
MPSADFQIPIAIERVTHTDIYQNTSKCPPLNMWTFVDQKLDERVDLYVFTLTIKKQF